MARASRIFLARGFLLPAVLFQLWIFAHLVGSDTTHTVLPQITPGTPASLNGTHGYWQMLIRGGKSQDATLKSGLEIKEGEFNLKNLQVLQRRKFRQIRKEARVAQLIQMSKDVETKMKIAAIERANNFSNVVRKQYSIWGEVPRQKSRPDSTLKLMNGQIITAKVYASIARSRNLAAVSENLAKHIKESQHVTMDATSDAELSTGALLQARAMGQALSKARDILYDCHAIARKLRVMAQSAEESFTAQKKKSMFLMQYATKAIPKPLHCLALQLANDYFLLDHSNEDLTNKGKLEDTSLYHYAIFSDNVLATSVVINSTALNAKDPENHVFHVVTDRVNFAAMKMWFIAHPPPYATVHVQSIDEFKWLNSSYSPVMRQKELATLKDYYFAANHPGTLSVGDDQMKYRNPKYLSLLNHIRFYLPELYPKLDKMLFLDDDVVVQRDLTPLWSIDMRRMVNGAVETCGPAFHRFNTYLNFSDSRIYENFDPNSCGWAFGMNIFDLKEWRKNNITGIYHYWQDQNKDRLLWKLGTLPAGLLTFYNLTYPIERSWHLLALGYKPKIDLEDIHNAAVLHYNGNYKPWIELAITEYKGYWSKYVMPDNPHLRACRMRP